MSYADNLRLRYLTSDEAVAKRRARAAARAAARNEVDRLAERARKIALWREHAKINRQFEPVSGCALDQSLAAAGITDGIDRLVVVPPQMELFV